MKTPWLLLAVLAACGGEPPCSDCNVVVFTDTGDTLWLNRGGDTLWSTLAARTVSLHATYSIGAAPVAPAPQDTTRRLTRPRDLGRVCSNADTIKVTRP